MYILIGMIAGVLLILLVDKIKEHFANKRIREFRRIFEKGIQKMEGANYVDSEVKDEAVETSTGSIRHRDEPTEHNACDGHGDGQK